MKGKLELLEGKNTWVIISENGVEVWPLHPEDFISVEFEIIDETARLIRPFIETWDHILRDHKDGFVRLPTGNYTTLAEFLRNNFYPPRRIGKNIN